MPAMERNFCWKIPKNLWSLPHIPSFEFGAYFIFTFWDNSTTINDLGPSEYALDES